MRRRMLAALIVSGLSIIIGCDNKPATTPPKEGQPDGKIGAMPAPGKPLPPPAIPSK
jgi:hypothetical protein